jgi:hypothetical protein
MKVNKKIVIGLICLVPLIMTGIVLAGSDEEGMVKSRGVEQIRTGIFPESPGGLNLINTKEV